ncbi:MAG: hypothetical protein V4598_00610 [Bdellovibrionota bacterium]
MIEKEYLCWHAGQNEGDAKEIKAPSMEEAARMAVDVWKNEEFKGLGQNKVTVFVKEDENTKSFIISRTGDKNAPEAFH